MNGCDCENQFTKMEEQLAEQDALGIYGAILVDGYSKYATAVNIANSSSYNIDVSMTSNKQPAQNTIKERSVE